MKSAAEQSVCTFQAWQYRFSLAAREALEDGRLYDARTYQRKAAESHLQATWAMGDHMRRIKSAR